LAHQKIGQLLAAESTFAKTVSINPDFGGAWVDRGLTRLTLGKFSEAIEDFNHALNFELDPESQFIALANRGCAYYLANQYAKA
ncbi:hypothetical protein ABTH71_20515, partial [Acinetobacter baumannii]